MRYFPLSVALAAFPIFLAATPLISPATAQQARPPAFAVCAGCHSTQAGKTAFGPSLAGVGGRRAAQHRLDREAALTREPISPLPRPPAPALPLRRGGARAEAGSGCRAGHR